MTTSIPSEDDRPSPGDWQKPSPTIMKILQKRKKDEGF
jgi:hypothetical protein